MAVTVGVIKEQHDNETRVAIVPETADKILQGGWQLCMQKEAGVSAGFTDAHYPQGVSWKNDMQEVLTSCHVLASVKPWSQALISQLKPQHIIVGMLSPHQHMAEIQAVAQKGVTLLSMESIPRTTRAQAMDVLSSQAAVAGYKAVLLAACESPRFFPMLTTAAGTIRPSSVLVIGAGVAGLQAIATAKRLGANVTGYDVRPETAEQIKSLGAKFLDLRVKAVGEGGYARPLTEEEKALQKKNLASHLQKFDVLITTAAIPGKAAPQIISTDMIKGMPAGSVVVDLAAESGGNCEPTVCGQNVMENNVTIMGPENLSSTIPLHASEMYSRNIWKLLELIKHDSEIQVDWQDDILAACGIVRDGEIIDAFKQTGEAS